jgi:hypothetical protein
MVYFVVMVCNGYLFRKNEKDACYNGFIVAIATKGNCGQTFEMK